MPFNGTCQPINKLSLLALNFLTPAANSLPVVLVKFSLTKHNVSSKCNTVGNEVTFHSFRL